MTTHHICIHTLPPSRVFYIGAPQSLLAARSVADGGNDGVLLSVVECDVKSRMELWQMFVENRLVHAKRTPVDLPSGVYVGSGTRCWAPGESDRGWFVFCDSSANVYRVRPEIAAASTAELCVEYTVDGGDRGGEGTPPVPAMLCPLAQGFVLHAAGRLTASTFIYYYGS